MNIPISATDDSTKTSAESHNLKLLLPYLKPYKLRIFGAFFALAAAAAMVLAFGSGLRLLVDKGLSDGSTDMLNQALLVMLIVVALLAFFSFMRFYLVSWLGERVVADIRRDVFARVINMEIAFFEINRTSEIISRLTADATILQTAIGSSISIALRNFLTLIGGLIMLVITSPKMSFFVLLAIPFIIVPIIILGRKVKQKSKYSQDRIADLSISMDENFHAIKVVKAFTHEENAKKHFANLVENSFKIAKERIAVRAVLTGLVIFLVFSAIGAILWAGGRDVLTGEMTAGQLSAFIFYAVLVAGATGALSEVYGEVQRAAGATTRIFELLALRSNIKAPKDAKHLPERLKGEIEFNNIDFAYPTRMETPAFEGLNLKVKSGEKLALIGESGAGKTTIFNLLLRFYDPQSGQILVDGVDIKKLSPQELRRHIAIVPQDTVIFSGTVRENILYGDARTYSENATRTDEHTDTHTDKNDADYIKAAKAAKADEFIKKLPNGYETKLGERGSLLSGGQRQRIAIARAILRDPKILLLDEATSALDIKTESKIQEALEFLMKDKTTLIIAHRPATIKNADRIIKLHDGKIIR